MIVGIILGLFIRDLFFDKPAAAKIVKVRSRNLTFQMEVQGETLPFKSPYRPLGSLTHGQTISITTPVQVFINDGGDVTVLTTLAETVGDLLYERQITLAETDQVSVIARDAVPKQSQESETASSPPVADPRSDRVDGGFSTFLSSRMEITIDRIVDIEVIEQSEIPYQIERTLHAALLYGREELVSKGEAGQKAEKFLVTYKNGIETARRLLSSDVLKAPVNEKVLFGTGIKVQETLEGRASWYAYQACLCAAHPYYEFGRYVRVTNLDSGKSIIARINDRGPDQGIHPERIIDLDSVAYKELASLGSGTMLVKVELLRN